jgi:hypothetical protein
VSGRGGVTTGSVVGTTDRNCSREEAPRSTTASGVEQWSKRWSSGAGGGAGSGEVPRVVIVMEVEERRRR